MIADGQVESYTPTIAATERAPEAAALEPGAVVGRYIVLTPLGAGGMGVVYAAYDPELDRKVALKLLRAEPGGGVDASLGRARLLREAQALARLSHPNVVAIHDVGTVGDRVWLAIEYIDGQTFGEWARAQPRSWREVLRVLLEAGRGLAAAHAAALVHRDLKPDNIMIGADGRVRVMDFGLARAAGPQEDATVVRTIALPVSLENSVLTTPVTHAGVIIGTPTYMAPEQWTGLPLDARVDQFAYCVTLWEALFGERPFAGETLVELATHIVQGQRRPPPAHVRVPAWLRRAVARGLLSDPAKRFPSMAALLAALEHGQARTRNRRLALGLGLGLLAVFAGVAWQRHDRGRRLAACSAAGAEIVREWNDDSRADLRAALVATGVAYADTTYHKLVPWVDRWTADWAERRAQLCRDVEVDGTQAHDLHEPALACLVEHREALGAALAALSDGDPSAVQSAVPMVAGLPALATCSDRAALERMPRLPVDPDQRARVAEVRRELQRADELTAAGRYAAGLERAEAALPLAEHLAYAPLIARANLSVGAAAKQAGKLDRAESTFTRAYTGAGAIGADELALDAALRLTYTVGYTAARHAEGLVWSRSAEMLVDRLDKRDTLTGSDLLNNIASIRMEQGRVTEALALFTRSLELEERLLGPDHPSIAEALNNLATAQEATGDLAAATLGIERALAIWEREFGPDHPEVATSLNNLAQVKRAGGDDEAAFTLHRRALALRERALPHDHPDLALSLSNFADVLRVRGEREQALALNRRALAIWEQQRGPDHPDVALALNNLALIHKERREYDQAIALQERALGIFERSLGPDHPTVAIAVNNLALFHQLRGHLGVAEQLNLRALAIRERLGSDPFGVGLTLWRLATVHRLRGEYDAAESEYQRALTHWQTALGPDDPELAWLLVGQGQLALARRQPDVATPLLERALALRGEDAGKPDLLAEARFALARALATADPARAGVLARWAADAYRELGDAAALAEVDAWSRAQP